MEVEVIEPHGFCSGVSRAIRLAESELVAANGKPVFCFGPIVHNEIVTDEILDLWPDVLEIRCICHITRAYSVDLDVPGIEVVMTLRRLDQRIELVYDTPVLIELGKSDRARALRHLVCGLKVYCGESHIVICKPCLQASVSLQIQQGVHRSGKTDLSPEYLNATVVALQLPLQIV